jgi:hypothetical protein
VDFGCVKRLGPAIVRTLQGRFCIRDGSRPRDFSRSCRNSSATASVRSLAARRAEKTLTLRAAVEHADEMPAREPMMVEHLNATLFVTGYGAPTPHLWRSDLGATWSAANVWTTKVPAAAARMPA